MMRKHLEEQLDNALNMYEEEQIKNIQLKKQYEIMKMNAEQLIEKNEELKKENNKLKQEIERLNNKLEEFKEEHKIMKQILIENNLWENLLNDDRFLEYLRK